MRDSNKNYVEAEKTLKAQIDFFQALLKHIRGKDESLKAKAGWTTYCLHNYINNGGLMTDIESSIKNHGTK